MGSKRCKSDLVDTKFLIFLGILGIILQRLHTPKLVDNSSLSILDVLECLINPQKNQSIYSGFLMENSGVLIFSLLKGFWRHSVLFRKLLLLV